MNRCRECLAELPAGAHHCPKCGRELGEPVTLPPSPPRSGLAGNWRGMTIALAVAGVVVVLFIVALVAGFLREAEAPAEDANLTAAAPGPARDLVATTVGELDKAYDENELTARDRFEGRPIRITGTVLRIGSNQGEPTLLLQSSRTIAAAFADPTPLKALKSGWEVTMTCDGLGQADAALLLRNCTLNAQHEPPAAVDRRTGPQ